MSKKKQDYICDPCYAYLMPFSEVDHDDLIITLNNYKLYPCKICKQECSLKDCIQCDVCFNWSHSECANLLELPFEMYVKHDYIRYICSNKC